MMADPKLLQIVKAIQTRLTAIDGTGDYYTNFNGNIIRGRVFFNDDELPGISIFTGEATSEENIGERTRVSQSISIEAHQAIAKAEPDANGIRHPEDIAIKMLADISRAMQPADRLEQRLGGLLNRIVTFETKSVVYPTDHSERVGCLITFTIPHSEAWGDPSAK